VGAEGFVIAAIVLSIMVYVVSAWVQMGIIRGLRYGMYGYYIVTQDVGSMEALQMSAEATDGHKSELFGLCLASMGVIILGTLCLGVGLVWAIPTVDIAWRAVFLQLSGQQTVPAAVLT
jgi:uncharacterized membrane protein